jgi:diketogulonate reductase-like aldo/keto reductase
MARDGEAAGDRCVLLASFSPVHPLMPVLGKAKAIGVSNFGVPLLKQLAADSLVKVVPAVNQVELHPCLPLKSLRTYAKENGIVVTAYSPIGMHVPLIGRGCR